MIANFWQDRELTNQIVRYCEMNNLTLLNTHFIISGCQITPNTGMSVSIASGEVYMIGTGEIEITSGNLSIDAADDTLNRCDLIVVNSSGTKSVIKGELREIPQTPAYDPQDYVVLGYVYVNNDITTIIPSHIINMNCDDVRYTTIKNLVETATPTGIYNTKNQNIYNIKTATFQEEVDHGWNPSSNRTLNLNWGGMSYIEFANNNITLSLVAPVHPNPIPPHPFWLPYTNSPGRFSVRIGTRMVLHSVNIISSDKAVKIINNLPINWNDMGTNQECLMTIRYTGTTYLIMVSPFYNK